MARFKIFLSFKTSLHVLDCHAMKCCVTHQAFFAIMEDHLDFCFLCDFIVVLILSLSLFLAEKRVSVN